jgi:hypothetical protein
VSTSARSRSSRAGRHGGRRRAPAPPGRRSAAVGEQLQGVPVGPVQVVEDQHGRPLARHRHQEPRHRVVQAERSSSGLGATTVPASPPTAASSSGSSLASTGAPRPSAASRRGRSTERAASSGGQLPVRAQGRHPCRHPGQERGAELEEPAGRVRPGRHVAPLWRHPFLERRHARPGQRRLRRLLGVTRRPGTSTAPSPFSRSRAPDRPPRTNCSLVRAVPAVRKRRRGTATTAR